MKNYYNRLTKDNYQLVPLQMWGRKSMITQDSNRVEIYPEGLNLIKKVRAYYNDMLPL